MNRIIKALNHEEKGFTLIELIVVIAILGILAAIAIPQYTGTLAKAKEKADEATAQTIADAAARYIQDNGSVPNSLDVATLVTAGYLQSESKPQESGYNSFTITITPPASGSTTGSVSVSPGNKSRTFEIISTSEAPIQGNNQNS